MRLTRIQLMNQQGFWPGLYKQFQEIIFDLESSLCSNLNYFCCYLLVDLS